MVFLLLSFQYQFKDKYFDAANLRLPHGVPSADEYLRFLGLEPIDIRFSLRDHSEGLPYKFVGDSNDRHTLPGLPLDRKRSKQALHSALHLSDEKAAT